MGYNRVHNAPDTYQIPALCKECPNFRGLKKRAEYDPSTYKDLTEADFALVAMRQCLRGKTNNPDQPCTIDEFADEAASRIIQIIASKTEKNDV